MSQIIILFLPFLISLINSDDSNKYFKAITDKDIFAKYYPKGFNNFSLLDWLWWISLYIVFIITFVF